MVQERELPSQEMTETQPTDTEPLGRFEKICLGVVGSLVLACILAPFVLYFIY